MRRHRRSRLRWGRRNLTRKVQSCRTAAAAATSMSQVLATVCRFCSAFTQTRQAPFRSSMECASSASRSFWW